MRTLRTIVAITGLLFAGIQKTAAQNSVDLMESPRHAGWNRLPNGLITKLSTESVRLCLQVNKPSGDGGLGR